MTEKSSDFEAYKLSKKIESLNEQIYKLEYKLGVLFRWCIIDSVLLLVFVIILGMR